MQKTLSSAGLKPQVVHSRDSIHVESKLIADWSEAGSLFWGRIFFERLIQPKDHPWNQRRTSPDLNPIYSKGFSFHIKKADGRARRGTRLKKSTRKCLQIRWLKNSLWTFLPFNNTAQPVLERSFVDIEKT